MFSASSEFQEPTPPIPEISPPLVPAPLEPLPESPPPSQDRQQQGGG